MGIIKEKNGKEPNRSRTDLKKGGKNTQKNYTKKKS